MTQRIPVTILNQGHMVKSLNDPTFFTTIPEFLPMQELAVKAKQQLEVPSGCSGCKKRRVTANLFGRFVSIAAGLDSDSANKLKSYLNAERLAFNVVNTATRVVSLKEI